jgi:hypothetical protein
MNKHLVFFLSIGVISLVLPILWFTGAIIPIDEYLFGPIHGDWGMAQGFRSLALMIYSGLGVAVVIGVVATVFALREKTRSVLWRVMYVASAPLLFITLSVVFFFVGTEIKDIRADVRFQRELAQSPDWVQVPCVNHEGICWENISVEADRATGDMTYPARDMKEDALVDYETVTEENTSVSQNDPRVDELVTPVTLYERSSSWGPCPVPEDVCWQRIALRSNGELTKVTASGTATFWLDSEQVAQFTALIEAEGLHEKTCVSDEIRLDAWTTYAIYGRDEQIHSPGCEEELSVIDDFIEANMLHVGDSV